METMDHLQSWNVIIGNFGFPIAITMYLLLRFEKKIESLQSAIENLIQVIKNWGDK